MSSRRDFLVMSAGALLTINVPAFGKAAAGQARGVTAVTQVFGDGLRLIAVAVEYGVAIDGAKLSASTFSVAGRTVTGAFTSTSADPGQRTAAGRFVIVTLSPEDPGAILAEHKQPKRGPGQPSGEPDHAGGPGGPGAAGGPGGPGPLGGPPAGGSDTIYKLAKASITQLAAIAAGNGTVVAPDRQPLESSAVKNLIVDDFKQLEFHDPKTGDTLKYNLFIPKNYVAGKSYPLVLFMHDAGATGNVTRTTLLQGLGAIAWASPEDQEQRPCFVLAPQYAALIADDNSQTTSMLDTTIDLVKVLTQQYSIDHKRLYATGQSGGCMMAIAMNIKYPDFFAASFLVAGQWDPALVKPLARKNLWILVSQDDDKAYPGQNAITAVLEKEGASISRATWDGTWTQEQFRAAYDKIEAEGRPINYVTFKKGTVIPPGQSAAGASGHRNTWRIAYTITPIREWLFQQIK
jgi:predicted peptidase